MKKRIIQIFGGVLVALVLIQPIGCKKEVPSREPSVDFSVVSGTSDEAVATLNSQRESIVKQVLERHNLNADDVTVAFGNPSGLGITVEHRGGKKVKLEIPPAKTGVELVTNFDHTLDRAVRRAAGIEEKK